jgi:hypothetical protein
MKIDIKEIQEGTNFVGKMVWICDYRKPDINKKPIRHVRPTHVLVRSNSELPKNVRIYYSNNHFCKLNKNGDPIASGIIPVFDNTGYRMYSGTPVQIFDNEKECNEEYCKMSDEIIKEIDLRMSSVLLSLNNEKEAIILEKSKYL